MRVLSCNFFPVSAEFPGGRRPGLTKIYSRIILDLLYIFIPYYFSDREAPS